MKINAIITSCGYVETQMFGSVVWISNVDYGELSSEQYTIPVTDLCAELLNGFYNHIGEKEPVFYAEAFQDWVWNFHKSTYDDPYFDAQSDGMAFTPYSDFSETFQFDKSEILFITESFETIITSFATPELVKLCGFTHNENSLEEYRHIKRRKLELDENYRGIGLLSLGC